MIYQAECLNDVQNLLSTNADVNAANSEGTTLVGH